MIETEQALARCRQLIDDRELDSGNLDTAEKELHVIAESDQDSSLRAKAYGYLTEIYYWRGELENNSEKLLGIYEAGVAYGKKGYELDEHCLEANFWLAVNYGLLADNKGILSSLFLIDPILHHVNKAMAIDESYFYGAPHRVLGYMYYKLPPWPISKGDKKKAIFHMTKSIDMGPRFFLSRLYLAEIYYGSGEREKAKEQLQWLLQAELSKNHEQEDARLKEKARKMMRDYGFSMSTEDKKTLTETNKANQAEQVLEPSAKAASLSSQIKKPNMGDANMFEDIDKLIADREGNFPNNLLKAREMLHNFVQQHDTEQQSG